MGAMLVLLAVLFIIVGGTVFWLWRLMKEQSKEINQGGGKLLTAQEFLGVEDIRRNMIFLPGRRYRSVIAVGSVNYPLLSEPERESVEIRYSAFLASLNFPIQIIDHTRPLDTDVYVTKLKQRLDQSPKNMKWYMEETINAMAQWTAENPVLIREKFLVVCYDAPSDMEQEDAILELDRRTASVMQGLDGVGLACKVATTEQILEILYAFFHKPNMTAQKLSYAWDAGWNAWEVRGDGVGTVAVEEAFEGAAW